ncbi:putative alpha,alpha-trehalose-phosphate synthase [Dorcoceras hygrometricum]|uniref:Putative alpha,alpha-trehalose-phosphate synthase n=1 Tax=Dorcoceras hygrometricum TaxID=472368 RepID=A0A2Z7A5P5_9LAMI|nr:putative alpha,alpha-trehalose-phosphate synthase [Dorcoceras hygrometricum]
MRRRRSRNYKNRGDDLDRPSDLTSLNGSDYIGKLNGRVGCQATLLGRQATLISTICSDLINGQEKLSLGSWFSPKNTTRPQSHRTRVPLSTVVKQRREDRGFLQYCGFHLRSTKITEYLARPRFPPRCPPLHRLSPSINTTRFVSLYSFTHSCTLLHTVIFALALSRASSDLSIGGASSDTLPTPSDECFVVADIQTSSPVLDARRARVLDVVLALG